MRGFHHLYLTGYRGSGKTSVGKQVAPHLLRPIVDLDDCIELSAGMSIRDIFAAEGESGFRNREAKALLEISRLAPSIVSLGGGAILRPENRETIAATGFCIWLKASVDTILTHINQDSTTVARRPLLTSLPPSDEVIAMLRDRDPIYASVSGAVVCVDDKSIDDVANNIFAILEGRPHQKTPFR